MAVQLFVTFRCPIILHHCQMTADSRSIANKRTAGRLAGRRGKNCSPTIVAARGSLCWPIFAVTALGRSGLLRCISPLLTQSRQGSLTGRERVKLARLARAAPAPGALSHMEGATDLDRIDLRLEAEIPRCTLNLHMAQKRPDRLQVAGSFQNVQSLRPPQRLDAVDGRIKTRFNDPLFYQAAQLASTHRAVSSTAAREQVIGALPARRREPFF